jgi:hypothetical protein
METKKVNFEKEEQQEVIVDTTLGFMNKNQKSKYASYYFGKVRTKKEIIPHFELSKEINGVIKNVTYNPPLQRISGKLNNIEFSEGTYQNQVIKSVVFKFETLTDTNNLVGIRINCSRNNALQNWLNCLIGCKEEIKSLELSLWKDKNTGFNKSSCRINGKKPIWAFNIEQLESKKEKIVDKKGNLLMTKTDEMFDFLEDELKSKLDILLPNRFREDEQLSNTEKFLLNCDEPNGETNVDEFDPHFD